VNAHTQAVLFNAVPLLLLAALYLTLAVSLVPSLWRERGRAREIGFATALVFPCVGLGAAILGLEVLVDGEPLAGNALVSFGAIVLTAFPLLVVARSWEDRQLLVSGVRRAREAEQHSSLRDRELAGIDRLAHRLLDSDDEEQIARLLLDELAELFGLDLANLALVNDGVARVVASRERGADREQLIGQTVSLDDEASGVGTVVREGVAFPVFDAASSPIVSKRLLELAPVKSCAFVPMLARDRVIGVVFAGVDAPRLFEPAELGLMQTLAAEAGLALERVRSREELGDALERERVIARISLAVRSRRDLDELLQVAVEETARAAGVDRCFIRLGELDDPNPVVTEWSASRLGPLHAATQLPVAHLALRERDTVSFADLLDAPDLADPSLGRVRDLAESGVRAALATPIVAFGRVIGVLGLHRAAAGPWNASDVALAEAVAHEAAIAIDTSRLLRESERRLAEQRSLLKAGEVLTSDLRVDVVLARLVQELRALVDADAADCWTLAESGELVCQAVVGLPESEVGRRVRAEGTVGEAIATGRPVLRRAFAATEQPPPAESYAAFEEVIDAPIMSFGETLGVIGVCSREADRFDEAALRLIEAFASLASVALRNAEAYEESTRQAQVQRGFYRIASVLSEPLSAKATFDAVAQAAAESLGAESAAVLRSDGGDLRLVGAFGLGAALTGYLREQAAGLTDAARAGKVLASRRLADDGRFGEGLVRAAAEGERRSLLAIPLVQAAGDELGLVLALFRDESVFDEGQLELAGHVAGAARGALERSELYERERAARSVAQRLARAGRELAGVLDPDDVLDVAARSALGLLPADGASVRMLEGDEVVLRAVAGGAEPEPDISALRTPSTAWLVGDIVQTRSARALEDASGDTRVREADPLLAAAYGSYLGVPIIGPDAGVLGILAVYGREPRRWRAEEEEALESLAATAATAFVNADLYQGVSHEQQRSEAILTNIADGIVAIDREGRVVLWNVAAERITGVPQRDATGRTPEQALGRPLVPDRVGTGGAGELTIRRGDDLVALSLTEAVMTDPAGAVAGRIYAFRDVSAEQSVERMKSDFVSTVSQELRSPLTSIYGFAETLLRDDVAFEEEERATFLRYISSESSRLAAIVDRLLSVAQVDTGAISMQLAEIDVRDVVNEAVRTAGGENGALSPRFVVSLDDGPLAAEADPEKLSQVLAHLLDNAIRFSPAGGTVTVAARRRDDAVEVSVEDEGVGIPAAEQRRIFRKFYRGEDATSTVGTGAAGLGLFLAEGLVTAMGGTIRVDSEEGHGATFVLQLRPAGRET
jgi:GAF domain-containing protein/anti-sigma regulatory factor (Ser/Thr protein kinase)